MTLQDAFRQLIETRGWHKNSGVIAQFARRDKQRFLIRQYVPEERIRDYLKSAGWVQTQQEEWSEAKVK